MPKGAGRRAINLLQPEARGRINGLFVGLFFLGGAAGAALAGIAWASGGWPMICVIGAGFGIAALVVDRIGRPEKIGLANRNPTGWLVKDARKNTEQMKNKELYG